MIEKVKHKGLALLVLAIAQFMVVLDATIVNVALPSIEHALSFNNASQLQWIVTAYTLVFGGFLMLGGRLADLAGRRRIFMTGIVVFAVASLAAGFSQNPNSIIAFRALQGLGGALLSPAALSLVLTIFKEGKERNRAMGVWSGVAAGGGAVGLLLGGLLTQYVNWRWIFFINVPIAALLMYLAMKHVPKSLPNTEPKRIDFTGAILVTTGLMTLVYALVKATDFGWDSAQTISLLGAAAALIIGFVVNESLIKRPLVPLKIFKLRNVSAGNLAQLTIAGGMFSVFFYLSIYYQQILGYSPVMAGVASLPFTLFIAASAAITTRLVAKYPPKTILTIAPVIMAAGLFYFSQIPVEGKYLTDILPGIALMATGMGSTFVALTLASTSGVSQKEHGLASGLLNTSQQIGGALGLAILTAISVATTKADLTAAQGNPSALNGAMVHGFQDAFFYAAFFAFSAAVIAAIGLKSRKLTDKEIDNEIVEEAETFPVVPGV